MYLSNTSIKYPVFATMLIASLCVLGFFSYTQMGVDLMPRAEYPTVFVRTSLRGASAEEIETTVTKPIEEAVNTISGIDELRSMSSEGSSRVIITFALERNIEDAVQDVRDKVAGVVGRFPRDTDPPIVNKIDPDSAPILTLVVSGRRSPREITEIAEHQIKEPLETINGVGSVSISGDRHREIQIVADARKLSAFGITIDALRSAIQRQNVEIPGGNITTGDTEMTLRTMGRVVRLEDFNNIIVANQNGVQVKLSDVAKIVDTNEEVRSIARLNGENAVSLQIVRQSGTNTVKVVDDVKARMAAIEPNLPPGLKVQWIRDQSRFIRKSIDEIQRHLITGGLLASLVVLLFIRNWRSTIIAAIAIPTSLISTFTVMRFMGFTLNNMTMLALSLSTGIVIDDAIVVLENIFRYIEEKGYAPMEAAKAATSEIGMAVMATTLSLVVIFMPVAFMTGTLGTYLFSFGMSAAFAIMISLLVSFTLTPMLCSRFLKVKHAMPTGDATTFNGEAQDLKTKQRGFYAVIDRVYGHMLHWAMGHRWSIIGLALLVAVSVAALYPYVGQEVVPDDDQGEFSIGIRLPQGSSVAFTDRIARDIENEVRKLPYVETIYTTIGGGYGSNIYVGLTPLKDRDISQFEIMRQARAIGRKFPMVRYSVSGGTDISGGSSRGGPGGGGNRLYVILQGPDIDQLLVYSKDIIDRSKTIPGIVDMDSNFEATNPELRVYVNREKASDLGVSVDSLASSLRTMVGGEEVSKYKEGDQQYAVRLRLAENYRTNPEAISQLMIPSTKLKTVRLDNVVMLRQTTGPAQIDRYNRMRQVSISAGLDGLPLGEAVKLVGKKIEEANLKPGYYSYFGGSARTLSQASDSFTLALILSILFIYMVLASQFNSFVHPLTIMTSLPLSLPAGLLTLIITGRTLNVYSAIGMLMLFGVVKKNAILQVDYTNTLRKSGMERLKAIITANHVRLRPILMTTMSIVAGMLPIAFGKGEGSGSRSSMAIIIVGGQLLSLLLTLLVTPVVYSLFDDVRQRQFANLFAFRFLQRRQAQPTP